MEFQIILCESHYKHIDKGGIMRDCRPPIDTYLHFLWEYLLFTVLTLAKSVPQTRCSLRFQPPDCQTGYHSDASRKCNTGIAVSHSKDN